MGCVLCGDGTTQAGSATVTLNRDEMTLVVKRVPAEVCATCGEEYISEEVSARLLTLAEEAAAAGVQVDVHEFVAA